MTAEPVQPAPEAPKKRKPRRASVRRPRAVAVEAAPATPAAPPPTIEQIAERTSVAALGVLEAYVRTGFKLIDDLFRSIEGKKKPDATPAATVQPAAPKDPSPPLAKG